MVPIDRSALRVVERVLAVGVLLIALVTFTGLPRPYPTWPTVGPVPVDPELVVPALLGLAVLAGALADGLGIGSVVTGALGVLTLFLATSGLYTLYAVETGGVFFGGLFTLVSGTALAVAVVVRDAARLSARRGIPRRLRNRIEN